MAACSRRSYTSMSEILSQSSEPSILKLCFSQHCWYYSHFYNCTTLIKETKHKKDKQNIQINNKPHLVLNTERCCQNYTIRNYCLPLFSSSNFLCAKIKVPLCCYHEIHPYAAMTTSGFAKPRLERYIDCGTN